MCIPENDSCSFTSLVALLLTLWSYLQALRRKCDKWVTFVIKLVDNNHGFWHHYTLPLASWGLLYTEPHKLLRKAYLKQTYEFFGFLHDNKHRNTLEQASSPSLPLLPFPPLPSPISLPPLTLSSNSSLTFPPSFHPSLPFFISLHTSLPAMQSFQAPLHSYYWLLNHHFENNLSQEQLDD